MSVMSLSIYLCRSSEPPHALQKECQQSSCRQREYGMYVIEAGSDHGCDMVVCEAADLLHAAHLMHGGTHAQHSTQSLSVCFAPSHCSNSPSPPEPSLLKRRKSSLCRLV